jgi:hypothetical protein
LESKEETQDDSHQDDLLWGKGIMGMVKRMVTGTEWG